VEPEVIIIGAGPCGAVLAGLLGKRGVSVTIIDSSLDVFPQPRAAHIDHTGLRTLQELGVLAAVLPTTVSNKSLDLVNHDHEILMRLPVGQRSVSGLPSSVYFYQPDLDRRLRSTMASMPGVDFRQGHEMLTFFQDDRGVSVTVLGPGGVYEVRGQWLIGCDGSRSLVRAKSGIELRNLGFDERWLVLDVKLRGPREGVPKDRVVQVCDPRRPHLTTPISADRQRFEFMVMPQDDPAYIASQPNTDALLSSWLTPKSYIVERSAIYRFHGLIAQGWRSGRVLIAGDAAHQMPPFLGQGMCSGLRDATNLSWKLTSVIRSRAPQSLLDTYESERSPHVRTIVEAAIEFGRVVCVTDPEMAAARDKQFLVDKQIPDSMINFGLPRLTEGRLVCKGGGSLFIQPVIEGGRLDDIIGSKFLIVARTEADLGHSRDWWESRLGARIWVLDSIPNQELERWLTRANANVAVVRPDRYVMAAGESLDPITKRVVPWLADEGEPTHFARGDLSGAGRNVAH
jgi:3-(3-hydroxy-phenyl)propionate hydroxylase